MKKTIVLHIGTPKTGTTSIQEYLRMHKSELHQDGFLVPSTSLINERNHKHIVNYCINRHARIPSNIKSDIYKRSKFRRFKREFYHKFCNEIQSDPSENVILSSEQLYGNLTKITELMKLQDLFCGLAENIHIIVYVREQVQAMCSGYSTKMKAGKTYEIPDPDQFSAMRKLDYSHRLGLWEDVFGIDRITLRFFDRESLIDGDIVSDFIETAGIPNYPERPHILNQSLNAKQCEFIRRVNHHIPRIIGSEINPLRKHLVSMVACASIQGPMILGLLDQRYLSMFDESNTQLNKRYFNTCENPFQKPVLSDVVIDQSTILSQSEGKAMARQIIDHDGGQNEPLCKCIAAIFGVEYNGISVPMSFVHELNCDRSVVNWMEKRLSRYPRLKNLLRNI